MSNIDIFMLLKSIKDTNLNDIIDKVTAASFYQQDILLGCSDGCIYKIENQTLEDEEESSFVTSILQNVMIIENQPIKQIEICSYLNMVSVLINDSIVFLDENPLQIKSLNMKLKNVTAFAIKEGLTSNDEYITEMCVALSTNKIQLYQVSPEKITIIKDISINLPSLILTLSFTDNSVCLANKQAYYLCNLTGNNKLTQLFQHQQRTAPKITNLLNSSGFLLLGPDGLGIFADNNGTSQRPPIQWSSSVRDFVAFRNHIIAIDNEFVTVHDTTNQQQIQTIYLPNESAKLVTSQTGIIIVSQYNSSWDLHQLILSSWSRQATQYLTLNNADKAASIASKVIGRINLDLKSQKKASEILSAAGFMKFKQKKFKESKSLFERAKTDLRELIICYPDILPNSYKFEPKIATKQSGFQLETEDLVDFVDYKWFLLDFLLEHRDSNFTRHFVQVIETALVKLYVDLEPKKFYLNLTMMLSDVDYEDLIGYLTRSGHYHACAILMQWSGQVDNAVSLWGQLVCGQLSDVQWPGWEFVKEVLINISNPMIIVNNIEWILNYDPLICGEILNEIIDRFQDDIELLQIITNNRHVLQLIDQHRSVKFQFLYKLCLADVLNDNIKNDELASLFIELLLEVYEDDDKFETLRNQFIQFLTKSNRYRSTHLLKQLKTIPRPMKREEALIRGQMGDHQTGLQILANELQDFQMAQQYCIMFSDSTHTSSPQSDESNLFMILLKIYLEHCNTEDKNENPYKKAAFDLLKSQSNKFNMKQVVSVLPDSWSLQQLRVYLSSTLSHQTSYTSNIMMHESLMRVSRMRQLQKTRNVVQNNKLLLSSAPQLRSDSNNNSGVCSSCGSSLDSCSFIKLIDENKLYHKHCYNST